MADHVELVNTDGRAMQTTLQEKIHEEMIQGISAAFFVAQQLDADDFADAFTLNMEFPVAQRGKAIDGALLAEVHFTGIDIVVTNSRFGPRDPKGGRRPGPALLIASGSLSPGVKGIACAHSAAPKVTSVPWADAFCPVVIELLRGGYNSDKIDKVRDAFNTWAARLGPFAMKRILDDVHYACGDLEHYVLAAGEEGCNQTCTGRCAAEHVPKADPTGKNARGVLTYIFSGVYTALAMRMVHDWTSAQFARHLAGPAKRSAEEEDGAKRVRL